MANPFSVEPPQWFSRLAQPSNAANALGGMAGRYLGAAASAATGTGNEQTDKQPYYQRFRTNLADSYRDERDPGWRLKEMRFRTEMAQFGLNVESYRFKNQLIQKQSMQEAQAMVELNQLQEEARSNGDGPNGVLNTVYRGNNPKVLTFWNNAQLMASRQLTSMRINSDKTHWNKMIDALDIEDRAVAMSMPREETTGLPAPETAEFIKASAGRKQARLNAIEKAKTEQNFKNLPLEAQMYERLKFYEREGDELGVQTMEDALARKKSQQLSKTDSALLNDALSRRRQASVKLADAKTQLIPAAKDAAQSAFDAADADVKRMIEMQSTPQANPTTAPAEPVTEVIRVTKDGRRVVFDAKTQKPLRYAD